MKKLSLTFAAALCLAVTGLTGCGGGDAENKVIEGAGDPGVTVDQQKMMEEQYKSGGATSGEPGN